MREGKRKTHPRTHPFDIVNKPTSSSKREITHSHTTSSRHILGVYFVCTFFAFSFSLMNLTEPTSHLNIFNIRIYGRIDAQSREGQNNGIHIFNSFSLSLSFYRSVLDPTKICTHRQIFFSKTLSFLKSVKTMKNTRANGLSRKKSKFSLHHCYSQFQTFTKVKRTI